MERDYLIVSEKEIREDGYPNAWANNLNGIGITRLTSYNDLNKAKEQYDKYQIGDIVCYDVSSHEYQVVPMTPEMLHMLISEKNSFPYHLLNDKYRDDPEILKIVLNSYNPISARGVYLVSNPISYALPNALTEENIELAFSKVRPIDIFLDENGKAVKKAILEYIKNNYSLSEEKYNSIENCMEIGGFIHTNVLNELTKKAAKGR